MRAVPADRRLWLVRRVVPLPDGARRHRPAPGGRVTVQVGFGHRLTARVDADAAPVGVSEDNLNRTIAAFEAGGVPHFRVPNERIGRTTLAVPDNHRARAEAILAELARDGAAVREPRGHPRDTGPRAPWPAAALPGERHPITQIFWPVADPSGYLVLGADFCCEIEYWRHADGWLTAPRPNPSADVVPAGEPTIEVPDGVFGGFTRSGSSATYRTYRPFQAVAMDAVRFPIDVVYTWVDGGDPDWLARERRALAANDWVTGNRQAANASRFISRQELRYSLRSVHCFAPWVRQVFLVTDGQVPTWLDVDHPRLRLVDHREIFGDAGRLPTFNSMAIETRLHHIPGLSEHFLYFNDDVFLGRPVTPQMFFTPAGQTRFFLSGNRVDGGPPTADEPPIMSSGKNNRAVIEREFGRYLVFKNKHTPHAARRSVLAEIERRCWPEVSATAGHQFRHPADVSVLSSLQHHWAYLTGRAVPGQISYRYVDLADPTTPIVLASMLRDRRYDTFCLNDTEADGLPLAEQAALLAEFLPAYFPFRSPYELPTGAGSAVTPHLSAATRS